MRFPFHNVDLGITVVSVSQNTRGSTLGRERAHYSKSKSVRSKSQEFLENSRETLSFSMICDEYCNPRQKCWNTCVRFPFPNLDLGITVVFSASKYAWLNIGEGEGTLQ